MKFKDIVKVAKEIRADLNEIANILGDQKNKTTTLSEAFSNLALTMRVGNVQQRFAIINKIYYDKLNDPEEAEATANETLKKVKEILITDEDSALSILIEIQKTGYEKTKENIENVTMILSGFNVFIKTQNKLCDIWNIDAKISKTDSITIEALKTIKIK